MHIIIIRLVQLIEISFWQSFYLYSSHRVYVLPRIQHTFGHILNALKVLVELSRGLMEGTSILLV